MQSEKLSDAIDLSHHLSRVARARAESPLKGLQKYFGKPGIISLAGGLPHPGYFPFASIGGDTLASTSFTINTPNESSPMSWLWSLFTTKEKTIPIQVPKYPSRPDDINLAESLQYSLARGTPALQEFIKDFTKKVYQPAYGNYDTLVHQGNTDGWTKAVLTLCNPGEGVLVEEWTYPSAISMAMPHGVHPVPVPIDGQGLIGSALRGLLSEWDEDIQGMSRPHVLYTIPVGQNPTGTTISHSRKQEIYDICVEYDIIIVEDDPYYFLQQADYKPPMERTGTYNQVPSDDDEFLSQLTPTYLRYDYQGRVIRLDTFSKTIAPGCRLGWFTCNPLFAERLERQGEATTQAPCGFSQALVTKLLEEWQLSGYLRWIKGLRIQYQQRRDFIIDCICDDFDVHISNPNVDTPYQGLPVYTAFLKPSKGSVAEKALHRPVFYFTPPTAGMFVWITLIFKGHPSFAAEGPETLEMKLWVALAEAGVLFGNGAMFAGDNTVLDNAKGHFRISFSNAEFGEFKKAIAIFYTVIADFYDTVP